MTLVFEDVNSNLFDIVSVAEEPVGDSLVEIFKLKFGHDIKAEVWLRKG